MTVYTPDRGLQVNPERFPSELQAHVRDLIGKVDAKSLPSTAAEVEALLRPFFGLQMHDLYLWCGLACSVCRYVESTVALGGVLCVLEHVMAMALSTPDTFVMHHFVSLIGALSSRPWPRIVVHVPASSDATTALVNALREEKMGPPIRILLQVCEQQISFSTSPIGQALFGSSSLPDEAMLMACSSGDSVTLTGPGSASRPYIERRPQQRSSLGLVLSSVPACSDPSHPFLVQLERSFAVMARSCDGRNEVKAFKERVTAFGVVIGTWRTMCAKMAVQWRSTPTAFVIVVVGGLVAAFIFAVIGTVFFVLEPDRVEDFCGDEICIPAPCTAVNYTLTSSYRCGYKGTARCARYSLIFAIARPEGAAVRVAQPSTSEIPSVAPLLGPVGVASVNAPEVLPSIPGWLTPAFRDVEGLLPLRNGVYAAPLGRAPAPDRFDEPAAAASPLKFLRDGLQGGEWVAGGLTGTSAALAVGSLVRGVMTSFAICNGECDPLPVAYEELSRLWLFRKALCFYGKPSDELRTMEYGPLNEFEVVGVPVHFAWVEDVDLGGARRGGGRSTSSDSVLYSGSASSIAKRVAASTGMGAGEPSSVKRSATIASERFSLPGTGHARVQEISLFKDSHWMRYIWAISYGLSVSFLFLGGINLVLVLCIW